MRGPAVLPDGRIAVLLSAHASDLVAADAEAILRYLDRKPTLEAVASSLIRTRRVRRFRAVLRAADRDELADGLRALVAGREHPMVARSAQGSAPRLAFVVPGQGNQWPGMGAAAYRDMPEYRTEADRCAEAFAAHGVDENALPLGYLTTQRVGDAFSRIEIQGAQFTHAVALAKVWQHCGIHPDITVGHSLGEVGAAYLAGAISLADAVAVVCARAQVADLLPGRYGMAVLGTTVAEAEELIAEATGWLELSAVNSPSSVVVSGEVGAVGALAALVGDRGQFAREIAVDYPGHTSAFEPLRGEMRSRVPLGAFVDAPVQFIGSATGGVVGAGTDFRGYWYQNLRNTVRFDRAVSAAIRGGAAAFVELSAHPALLLALGELTEDLLPDGLAVLVGSGRRDEPLAEALSANIVAAAVADPAYRWDQLVGDVGKAMAAPPLRDFPNAPMRAVHLWASPEPLPPAPGLTVAVERWEQSQLPAPTTAGPPRRVAIFGLGSEGALTRTLRAAVERHPGAVVTHTADADLVVVAASAIDHPDAVRAADEIGVLVGAGQLDYAELIGARCRDVWLVTVGGEQVRSGEPVALPAQAALAAMHRSIGFEHVDQIFRHLDVPSWQLDDTTATGVVEILLADVEEAALRETGSGATVYRRTLAEDPAPAPPWPLDSGVLDEVVITGGSGAIGMNYARYLAERGAKRIVLLSRHGVDKDAVAELIGAHGTEIVSPRCDVTDGAALAAVAADCADGGASLLIHAAGTAAFATGDRLTAAEFAETCAAKLTGLTRITELWPLRADARIVLCSSVTGVWGGKGVVGYAAANRMLDVMAGQLRAKGTRCTAVRWGLWQGSSIVDAAETARVQRSGLRPMSPLLAIEASLCDHRVDPLVLSADANRLRLFLGTQTSAASGRESFGDNGSAGEDRMGAAEGVRTALASVLSVTDDAALDLGASLFDLGVDSLLALDLRRRISRVTGRTVPLARLLGGVTAHELIADLEERESSRD